MAEKWAILHQIPFPPVKEIVKQKINQPIEECYVFKDPENNPDVPVVILFTLVNKAWIVVLQNKIYINMTTPGSKSFLVCIQN